MHLNVNVNVERALTLSILHQGCFVKERVLKSIQKTLKKGFEVIEPIAFPC